MKLFILLAFFSYLSLFGINNLQAADMKVSKPEKMGMSSTQLAKLNQLGQRYVENGQYAGAVLLVARDGNIVHESAHDTNRLYISATPLIQVFIHLRAAYYSLL